jgi:DNA-binding response OmpR family regulator
MAHILVVEDERRLADLISRQLTMVGHDVRVAEDGVTALEMLERNPAGLVILDWMLPRLDGLEVCRRIRAHSITPILMLTARAGESDRVLGLEVGADDYLTKPFGMPELLARALALLRRVELMPNLIRNAVRHTPDGGIIVMSVSREAEWVLVSVADTGEGISAQHLPRIFDRFYRASPSCGNLWS